MFWLQIILLASLSLVSTGDKARSDGTGEDGVKSLLDAGRYPTFYTTNYGDCFGGQRFLNIGKFAAAFYADNSTFLFHLDGTTPLRNESVMSMSSLPL